MSVSALHMTRNADVYPARVDDGVETSGDDRPHTHDEVFRVSRHSENDEREECAEHDDRVGDNR